jgi:hypothetical protein
MIVKDKIYDTNKLFPEFVAEERRTLRYNIYFHEILLQIFIHIYITYIYFHSIHWDFLIVMKRLLRM